MSTGSGNSAEWTPGPSARTPGRQLRVLEALDQARVHYYHLSAVLIAGMGFFTDAYDLFVVGVVTSLLGRIYYPGHVGQSGKPGELPIGVYAAVTGTALLGTLTGQIIFGWLGDKVGRKKAYGITLTIMFVFSIASGRSIGNTPEAVLGTLCFFRFWLGVGIGGDYPLSATIMSEYANTQTRGAFIAAVFAMQGFGILAGGFVGLFLSAIFKAKYPTETFSYYNVNDGKNFEQATIASTAPEADYIWRIIFMLGAIPAAATFYYRMRMPETARYTALVTGNAEKATSDMSKVLKVSALELSETVDSTVITIYGDSSSRNQDYKLFSREFVRRHGLELLGTATTWFLLDVFYYSQTLFQSRIFRTIGWTPDPRDMNAIEEVYKISRAQVIVAACATVPGYWVCVFLVDRIGRFIIQLQGFIFIGIFLFSIAFSYDTLINGERKNINIFLVLYSFTFFFANFGPNSTTFIIPAELFPARLRATCHGISAGAGKMGALVGAFGFLYASQSKYISESSPYPTGIGLKNSLYIMGAVSFVAAGFTFLIPETKKRSLEYLSGENNFRVEVSPGVSRIGGKSPMIQIGENNNFSVNRVGKSVHGPHRLLKAWGGPSSPSDSPLN
ncbi:unnamed protein product [Calypogeia fissa]